MDARGKPRDLQEPARLTTSPSRKRTWWRKPETVIPIIVSLIAVGFTGATYWQQRQANSQQFAAAAASAVASHEASSAAALASRQAAARLVSYYIQPGNNERQFVVILQNLGHQPVYEIEISSDLVVLSPKDTTAISATLQVGQLPACSDSYVNLNDRSTIEQIASEWGGLLARASRLQWTAPGTLTFTDSNGLEWEENAGGPPVAVRGKQFPSSTPDAVVRAQRISGATGCS